MNEIDVSPVGVVIHILRSVGGEGLVVGRMSGGGGGV